MTPIVIIEDSDQDYLALRRALDHLHLTWPHERFVDADDALDSIREGAKSADLPKLILLDLNLPGTDGREFLRELREDPEIQEIEVIVLSTSTNPRDRDACGTLGVLDYQRKPVSFEHFVEVVSRINQHWEELCVEPTLDVRRDRVMLISEDTKLASRIAEMLEGGEEPRVLEHFSNPNEGLDHFTREVFDHVLLDQQIEADEGIALVECMRGDPQRWHTPIIMLASARELASRQRAVKAGVSDYLLKDRVDQATLSFSLSSANERERDRIDLRKRLERFEAQNRLLRRQRDHLERELARIAESLDFANVSLKHEVAARDELSHRLRTADRLATVGRLARGLAQVINNPLSYAMGNLELCRRLLDEDLGTSLRASITSDESLSILQDVLAEFDTSMREALDGMERVGNVASRLSGFSRIPEDQFSAVDAVEVLDTVVQLTIGDLRGSGKVSLSLKPLPRILAQRSGLLQLFTNLIGHIAEMRVEARTTLHILTEERGEDAVIVFEDHDVLVPAEVFDRFFEPRSMPTAPNGKNQTDVLALPLVYHLMRELGGQIDAQSNPERGFRFTLSFPSFQSLSTEAVQRITGQFPKLSQQPGQE